MIEPRVIGFAGQTGAGKTTLRKLAQECLVRRHASPQTAIQGFTIGDVFRGIVERKGGDPTDRNLLYRESEEVTRQVSHRNFPIWLIKNTPDINWDRDGVILVDGIRHPDEAQRMKKIYPTMILVYCDCSLEERIVRLRKRGASQAEIEASTANQLEADYSQEFLAMEGVIVASPDVPIEETVRQIVERIERLL